MDIKVLGPGCAECKATEDIIAHVAAETGKPVTIEKVEDMRQIVGFGVMATPAEAAGAEVTRRFGHVLWQLEGITSASFLESRF